MTQDRPYITIQRVPQHADAAPLSGTYEGEGATNTLAVDKRLDLT
jgi:hypothetical protein